MFMELPAMNGKKRLPGQEDELFEKPEWLGEEVTGDLRYYNAMLAHRPYRSWK